MAAKTTTTDEAGLKIYYIGKTIAYAMFAIGLGLSITHIFDFFHHTLGAAFLTAAAMPVFVDGLQLFGRLIRSDAFAEPTRKLGWKVQLVGAALSLIANVVAGNTVGDKIGGAILVIGYVSIEALVEKVRPAAEDTAAVEQAEAAAEKAKRSAAATKAAATRKAKKEAEARDARRATARKTRTAAKKVDAVFADAEAAPATRYI